MGHLEFPCICYPTFDLHIWARVDGTDSPFLEPIWNFWVMPYLLVGIYERARSPGFFDRHLLFPEGPVSFRPCWPRGGLVLSQVWGVDGNQW